MMVWGRTRTRTMSMSVSRIFDQNCWARSLDIYWTWCALSPCCPSVLISPSIRPSFACCFDISPFYLAFSLLVCLHRSIFMLHIWNWLSLINNSNLHSFSILIASCILSESGWSRSESVAWSRSFLPIPSWSLYNYHSHPAYYSILVYPFSPSFLHDYTISLFISLYQFYSSLSWWFWTQMLFAFCRYFS